MRTLLFQANIQGHSDQMETVPGPAASRGGTSVTQIHPKPLWSISSPSLLLSHTQMGSSITTAVNFHFGDNTDTHRAH